LDFGYFKFNRYAWPSFQYTYSYLFACIKCFAVSNSLMYPFFAKKEIKDLYIIVYDKYFKWSETKIYNLKGILP